MICKVLPENIHIELHENEILLNALQREKISISAPCGGNGVCGKCAVRVTAGNIHITPEDERFFTKEQLDNGYRLSCKAVPKGDITIEILGADNDLAQVSSDIYGLDKLNVKPDCKDILAVDIGTTTIAMALICGKTKTVKKVYTGTNHQRAFGADVISRIVAATEGKAKELGTAVKEDIANGVKDILGATRPENVEMIITGNTTMEHLLLGYDVSGLGVYPFTPVSVEAVHTDWNKLFGNEDYFMPITIMPGFTTYVGADILAGILACGMTENNKATLLIDLGTNGEMALAAEGKLLITSTAAGPAFEGGNISCGMPGIGGAVAHVKYEDGSFVAETIGGLPARGICGSGIIDAIAEMVENEILDETGLLDDDYFDDGVLLAKGETEVVLTQKDIREMQLAKSAVRAGLETLLKKASLGYDDVEHVYLAGGFGQYIDIDSAVSIGLIPEELKEKIVVVGNTALAGAVCFGMQEEAKDKAGKVVGMAEEIDLSTDPDFKNGYMEYIMFGE